MALLLKASKVIEGNPEELVIEAGQVIIGRLPSNHLVIPGSDVEPIHAMIEVDPQSGEASLVDMASEAGVRLNGRVIEVVEPLKAGDKIQIGDVRIDVLPGEGSAVVGRGAKSGSQGAQGNKNGESASTQKAGAAGATAQGRRTKRDDYRYEGQVKRVPTVNYGFLFEPGKERPHGSTLEVVAFWDQSILDVRHYGGNVKKGEIPRPATCVLGNEEDDQLIGIGPRANTRNYTFAKVEGSNTVIYLNDEMKGRVRRGGNFEKVAGPTKLKMKAGEMALVKHGPVSYFLTNVSLPNPILKRFEDLDGRPLIFIYALFLYGLLSSGMYYVNRNGNPQKPFDEDSWAETLAIRTPTPKPKDNLPAPKPEVEVKKPEPIKPPEVKPPEKKPEPPKVSTPVKAPEVKPVVKEQPKEKPDPVKAPPKPQTPVALQSPKKPSAPNPNPANAAGESKANEKTLGPKSSNNAGNGGGKAGGTSGAFAGARAGNSKSSAMGVEGGKKDVMSGINLDKLGAGLGKISDLNGVGAIATGLQSSAGGAGGGSGSAGRGAHGFGGIGKGNSLSTGGPARALNGLGGGAGGLGAGGLGGTGNAAGPGGAGGKIKASAVVVPEGDPAVEGSLTKEEIEAVIRANLAQIKACYERFLQGNRNLAGRVTTNFVIGGDGRVNSANIASSDLGSPGAEGCMAGAIRRWKFPLPRGGGVVSVKYPFVFNSR
ncbi:MAG: AgmX/PglI C-terminal domain-containing protein [Silvanigrellales bacterium]|nr:AgmX/PglI C-terminal domain-containing protein [Silvanigrellales bacterium]